MSRFVRPGVVVWGLLGGLALAGLAWAGTYVWDKHRQAEARLAEVEPRYARLAGMKQRESELTEQAEQSRKRLDELVYPSGVDAAAAGNDAQQRVRQVFASAGLSMASSQTLEPKVEGAFDRIPMTMRLDGDVVALQTALAGLDTLRPVIWIDGMSVQAGSTPPGQSTRLNISFNLSVLRGRS